ncbi:hypothetical protein BCR36DRAFT_363837 [Piromyces finnis]|uniref:Sequence orphan n=1 Tax=Piromyces finnis TaxID=1754191 RepID=A0A1Y1UUS5_9FUNG|nr:hypothetical protein BCR36DRAFT_363837 [Piromyces finnis]|eukprot:ORX41721.1 hypothetical protein BCR36DRAFT_363837 [Piromyces finnis]
MIYLSIKNILIYISIFQIIQVAHAKNSYRVDHHLNVLNDAQWESVPITLNNKSKINSFYTNVKSFYNKSIVNPFNKYISTSHHEYETINKNEENTIDNIEFPRLTGENAFFIDFNCNVQNNVKFCKNAEKAFKKAADTISNILYIYSGPILINATLTSFCELAHPDGSACNADDPTRRKLGQAYPYSSFPVKAVDPIDGDTDVYLYPQALLRQLDIQSDYPDFNQYDITAEFNSDVNWYFEEDEDDSIDDDQHDFLYVAIHELIHGLGFISSWRTLLDMDFHYLTPRAKQGIAKNEDIVLGWYQMQILDKYISLNKTGMYLREMGKKIMSYGNSGDMVKQNVWLEGFHKSESGQAAQEVYDIATSGKNVFSIMSIDNELITYLQTIKNTFIAGICMGHLDNDEYTNKPDFLLRPYVPKGEDVNDLIEKGSFSYLNEEEKSRKELWYKTAFGPHLISIMETIGWPTKYHPERRKVEVISGSPLQYAKSSWNIFIIFATLIIILF